MVLRREARFKLRRFGTSCLRLWDYLLQRETIYDTIIREIKEETNLDIEQKDLKIFNVYSGEEQHHIYPNKDEVSYTFNKISELLIECL